MKKQYVDEPENKWEVLYITNVRGWLLYDVPISCEVMFSINATAIRDIV